MRSSFVLASYVNVRQGSWRARQLMTD